MFYPSISINFLKLFNFFLIFFVLFCLSSLASARQQETSFQDFVELENHSDDLPAIGKRKILRALVSYSKTDFFFTKGGTPQGLQVELLKKFEAHINQGIRKEVDKIHIQYIPTSFDRLIPDLLAGRGDIIANLMTITPEREKKLHFVSGKVASVQELLISHKSLGEIRSLSDLAGQTIYVLKGSSYVEHLRLLNRGFKQRHQAAIKIIEADAHLSTEDILELVNSGSVKLTVSDDYKARLWAKVLPDIRIHESVAIKTGTHIGWAVRKNNPQLQQLLSAFLQKVKKGTLWGNMLFNRYYKEVTWITDPNADKERDKLLRYMDWFERYAEQYGFDGLAIAAQAYQESRLDQTKKSPSGAIGIMQILPTTATDKHVAIGHIGKAENNIHAGVKYLAFLRDHYFDSADISAMNKLAFSWAAYNAGPARVREMRTLAKTMGLDPNVWYGNVELAAGKLVGRETVHYVSNIFKYYIAYSLVEQQRRKAH